MRMAMVAGGRKATGRFPENHGLDRFYATCVVFCRKIFTPDVCTVSHDARVWKRGFVRNLAPWKSLSLPKHLYRIASIFPGPNGTGLALLGHRWGPEENPRDGGCRRDVSPT